MFSLTHKQFYFWLGLLALSYLGFELFFNAYAMLAPDEFWFAHLTYRFKDALPYRDFAPYKTVLGYYLLLMPMLIDSASSTLHTLIFIKNILALLNTFLLILACCWLRRFFSSSAIIASITILIASENVLSYSTNIRVDLLGYWFCLFALLFLLENRLWLAGCLMGLGFITTQKAIWYILASNCAFLGMNFIHLMHATHSMHPANSTGSTNSTNSSLMNSTGSMNSIGLTNAINVIKRMTRIAFEAKWQLLGQTLHFNLGIALIIIVYLLFWSQIADWHTVTNSVFHEASIMYKLDWYDSARLTFWKDIILHNPVLIFLWPLTVVSLFISYEGDTYYPRRFFTVICAFIMLGCLVPYKQIFPYYLQVAIPALLLLYTAFFQWCFAIFNTDKNLKLITPPWLLYGFLILYCLLVIGCYGLLLLPIAYLLMNAIPIFILIYARTEQPFQKNIAPLFFRLISLTILLGLICPLSLYLIYLAINNGDYQKAHIRLVNHLVLDGSDYVAGVELLYNKNQPIAGFKHLVGPGVDYLYYPSESLLPFMLASLYLDPHVTEDSVIFALKRSAVKFYVNNYRIESLPSNIKNYLHQTYQHLWGSIYLYAPHLSAGKYTFLLKFSGNYLIEADAQGDAQADPRTDPQANAQGDAQADPRTDPQANAQGKRIALNGKSYQPMQMLYLTRGIYSSDANVPYRLKLIPQQNNLYDPRFYHDQWKLIIGG